MEGGSIKLSDAKKHMPLKIKHYGNIVDDFGGFKYTNYLKKK